MQEKTFAQKGYTTFGIFEFCGSTMQNNVPLVHVPFLITYEGGIARREDWLHARHTTHAVPSLPANIQRVGRRQKAVHGTDSVDYVHAAIAPYLLHVALSAVEQLVGARRLLAMIWGQLAYARYLACRIHLPSPSLLAQQKSLFEVEAGT